MLPINNNKIFRINLFKAYAFIAWAFFCISAHSQNQCEIKDYPFKGGEQLNYDAYYNLKNMWVPAGKVRFEIEDSVYEGNECFYFSGKGKSLKSYDYFFRVRDHYSSLALKKDLAPVRFTRRVSEGGFKLFYDYKIFPEENRAELYTKKFTTTPKTTIDFNDCVYDVMTAVNYARCLNFSRMQEGDTIPISMMVDKKTYDNLYIRYAGREVIKGNDGKHYRCIKFRPLLIEGTIFEDGEYMEVYVTDDKNHVPIYIEAEILVGSIRAYLTSYKNLKYPVTCIED